jgi:hypothetical protein
MVTRRHCQWSSDEEPSLIQIRSKNIQEARYCFAMAAETGVGRRSPVSTGSTGAASVKGVRKDKALRRIVVESVKTFIVC